MLSKEGSLELEAGEEYEVICRGKEERNSCRLGILLATCNLPYREISYVTADSKMGFQAEHQLVFFKAFLSEFL